MMGLGVFPFKHGYFGYISMLDFRRVGDENDHHGH